MNLQTTFQILGLKEEHVKIYLANLEWGETIITNIARKSKVPRTTIYILIKDLLNLGLVTQSQKDGKPVYTAADPSYIQTLLKQKQLDVENSLINLEKNMDELRAKQNANPKKPKVEFLEGSEGIKQAYNRTFEAKEEMRIQCFTADYGSVVSEKFFDDYFEKFFKQTQIKSKELLTNDDDEGDYINQYGSGKNLQLRVDVKNESIETDFWVYDDKVTFVSFNKERPYALVIEDKDMAKAMKKMYDLAWEEAYRNDSRVKKGEKVRKDFA